MSELRRKGAFLACLVVLGACACACGKAAKSEAAATLEPKEETVYGYAMHLPHGAAMRIETTTPGEPSSRVFTAEGLTIEVRVADRDGPLMVRTLDQAVTSIPPAGMARPMERVELSPHEYLVVTAPAVGMNDVWVWRQGTTRFARARCLGPDTKLARLKEICSSLRAID